MIAIREFREEDTEAMFAAITCSAKELLFWMTWYHENYTLQEVKQFIQDQLKWREEDQAYNFVIEDSETGTFLGSVGLNQIDRLYKRANLGYWVRTDKTGQNIAAQATRQAAHFGINKLGLQRIEIIAAATNAASCRVAEKAGAVKEGLLRNRVLVNHVLQDGYMYAIVKEDLDRLPGTEF